LGHRLADLGQPAMAVAMMVGRGPQQVQHVAQHSGPYWLYKNEFLFLSSVSLLFS
jgi:hypothetical protein